MKFIITFLCGLAACALQGLSDEEGDGSFYVPDSGAHLVNSMGSFKTTLVYKYREGDRFFYFPDGEGKLHLVDMQEEDNENDLNSNTDNLYMLYTRFNLFSPQFLIYKNKTSLRKSFFKPAKKTVIYAHGWKCTGYSEGGKLIAAALLQKEDVNVILLDWSRVANGTYPTVVKKVPTVGGELGKLVLWLKRNGLRLEKTHLVGHSLGAHLVGNAGRAIQGKVRRITALDPAGPCWYANSYRVSKADAKYVEVIHTDGVLGHFPSIGHANFYPNGGIIMPGCDLDPSCSHSRAYEYFASTVKFNHLRANDCNDAGWRVIWNLCNGSLYEMGNNDLNKSRSGIFRVNTGPDYPYAISDSPIDVVIPIY